MKLKFDSGLDYQLEAIKSVTDIFEGLPKDISSLSIKLSSEIMDIIGGEYSELGIGNNLVLSPDQLLTNLQSVQARNYLPKSLSLTEACPYYFPNLSIEMETGTGKTYVYLRTIFELNKLVV